MGTYCCLDSSNLMKEINLKVYTLKYCCEQLLLCLDQKTIQLNLQGPDPPLAKISSSL